MARTHRQFPAACELLGAPELMARAARVRER